jgi:hypothetical protein
MENFENDFEPSGSALAPILRATLSPTLFYGVGLDALSAAFECFLGRDTAGTYAKDTIQMSSL